jgi:hypothetical protein
MDKYLVEDIKQLTKDIISEKTVGQAIGQIKRGGGIDMTMTKKAGKEALKTAKAGISSTPYVPKNTPAPKTVFQGKVGLKDKALATIKKIKDSGMDAAAKSKAIAKVKAVWASGKLGKAGLIAAAAAPVVATAGAVAYKRNKARRESEIFRNALEDVITERFLDEKIDADKYLRLMEKVQLMTEGKALDILQEITVASAKEKIGKGYEAAKGAATKGVEAVKGGAEKAVAKTKELAGSVSAKAKELIDYCAKKTGQPRLKIKDFVVKYYHKFGKLPTAAKVIAVVGTGAAAVGTAAYQRDKK